MADLTDAQRWALERLAEGPCWSANRTERGRLQGLTARRLLDAGLASREWVGEVQVSLRGVVGQGWLYRLTAEGRARLNAPHGVGSTP